MTAAERVISIALNEVGYREKAGNSRLDEKTANAGSGNFTKYGRDLDALNDFYNGAKNGYAWCDVFVDWCFVQAFGAETARKLLCQPDRSAGAGCTYSAQYYRNKGRFHTTGPKAGDQIFFGTAANSTHTGLVTKVENGRVYTVEGNTSNGVYEKNYALGASNIYGYGRPDWSLAGEQAENGGAANDPYADKPEGGNVVVVPEGHSGLKPAELTLPQLVKGMDNETVRAAQILLIGRGYKCGSMGADGDFGQNTKNAVVKYQQMHDLEDDGVIGVNTWTSLLTRK